jgi:hypothetical protein
MRDPSSAPPRPVPEAIADHVESGDVASLKPNFQP